VLLTLLAPCGSSFRTGGLARRKGCSGCTSNPARVCGGKAGNMYRMGSRRQGGGEWARKRKCVGEWWVRQRNLKVMWSRCKSPSTLSQGRVPARAGTDGGGGMEYSGAYHVSGLEVWSMGGRRSQ